MTAQEIKELLATTTIPVFKMELDLGMPISSLNKAKNDDRKLPTKYIQPLKEYIANNIPKPSSELTGVPDTPNQIEYDGISHLEILAVVDYCKEVGCSVFNLINAHKEVSKPKPNIVQTFKDKMDETEDLKALYVIKEDANMTKEILPSEYSEVVKYYNQKVNEIKSHQKTYLEWQAEIRQFKLDYPTEEEGMAFALKIEGLTYLSEKQRFGLQMALKN